jgi:GNAT superfamily N-acetyltransferase
VKPILFPPGFVCERLSRKHRRAEFACGDAAVEGWLRQFALQQQEKQLSVTTVLVDQHRGVAGYFTLAPGQVDFGELPEKLRKKLPKRALPVVFLAWLGVSTAHQNQGLGTRLLAQALRDCQTVSHLLPFVAVVIDSRSERGLEWYRQWDFEPVPSQPNRLFLSSMRLEKLVGE